MSNYRSIDIVSAQQRTTRNTNVFIINTHTPSTIDKEVYEHLHIGDKKVTNK